MTEARSPQPYAASTCIQVPYWAQSSAISGSGSMEPKSVVPAVATTAMGTSPSSRQRSSSRARATVCIRLSRSTGMVTTASGPRPRSVADFLTLKWLTSEANTRILVGCSACSDLVSSRASSSAWRLDWEPPEVKTPSAAGPRPIRLVVQSMSLRSIRVPCGRLVPGVEGGVDRGEHGLADHGRDDDRAVEVGEVARVVEVDRVAEVDLFELVQRGGGVEEGRVQVHGVDAGVSSSTVTPVNGRSVVASLAATRSIPSVTERR